MQIMMRIVTFNLKNEHISRFPLTTPLIMMKMKYLLLILFLIHFQWCRT